MARLTVTMVINDEVNSEFDTIGINETNNVSMIPHYDEIPINTDTKLPITSYNEGHNGIAIGEWRIGEPGAFVPDTGYTGFMWGVNETVEINIVGDLPLLSLYFDEEANQYPKTITVYDRERVTTYENSKTNITVQLSGGKGITRKIVLSNWNRANYNACLTHLESMAQSIVFEKKNILSIDSQTQATNRPENIEYGLLGNTGSIRVKDENGDIKRYGELGYFSSKTAKVIISVNGKNIQTHYVGTTNYQNDNTVYFSLKNDIESFSDMYYDEIEYTKAISLYDYLYYILVNSGYVLGETDPERSEIVDEMLSKTINTGTRNDPNDITVKTYLKRLIINPTGAAFTIKRDNLQNGINNVCEVAQLLAFKDFDDKLTFINGRPIVTTAEMNKVYEIPARIHQSKLSYSEITSNWYDEVKFK